MPERATVLERVQIGVEATAGVAVAAQTRLLCTAIRPLDPEIPVQRYKGPGNLYNRAATTGYEQSDATIEGVACYNDLVPLLSAHLKLGVFSGNTATFTPSTDTANTIKTLSVEVGQAARAEKFDYAVVSDLSLNFNRTDGVQVRGTIFGRDLSEGATLSTVTTTLASVPIGPADWDVFLGTSADLSDLALLDRVLEFEFRSNGRWIPLYAANPSEASFASIVEQAPDCMARLVVENDANGSALVSRLRDNGIRFVRLRAVGPGGATAYNLLIEMPVLFTDVSSPDTDGVVAREYVMEPVHNSASFGAALRVKVVSDLTAW